MREDTINFLNNIKAVYIAFFGIIIAFLAPIIPLILVVGAAIVLDTFTGVYKSYRLKVRITSKKLSGLISKMFLYQVSLILFFCVETYVLQDIIGVFTKIPLILTKLVTTTLLFIELTSVNENYQAVTGNNLWLSFRDLLKRAKEVSSEIKDI
jgi:hypothetical protein